MKQKKGEFNVGLKITTFILSAIILGIVVVAILLKHLTTVYETYTWVGTLIDFVYVCAPIALSIFGITIYQQFTSFRNVINDSIRENSKNLINGNQARDFLLSCKDSEYFFDLFCESIGKEENINISESDVLPGIVPSIRSLILSSYLELDEMNCQLIIKNNCIEKTVKRHLVIINRKENDKFVFEIEHLSDCEVVVKEVKVNGTSVLSAIEKKVLENEDAMKETTTYNCVTQISIPLDFHINRHDIEFEATYSLPITDKVCFFVAKVPTRRLKHIVTVITDLSMGENVYLDLSQFAMVPSVDQQRRGEYILTEIPPNTQDNLSNSACVSVIFNDWSFPGDGYGYLIRTEKKIIY